MSPAEVWYRIIRVGSYVLFSAVGEIAGSTAEFTTVISIAYKLLSTFLANEGVICFAVDCIRMRVPPGHTAGIRAKLFCSFSCWLPHICAASHTTPSTGEVRMAANMRAYGIRRKMEYKSDISRRLAFHAKAVYCNFFLWFHNNSPFVMFILWLFLCRG